MVEAAIDAVRPAAEAKAIRLQSVLDPRAGPVSGDPDRLQQVVWNLLSNSIKFTPRNGRVQVRLARVNSHVEIVVTDSGQGIGGDVLPHVFERFRQAESGSQRSHGGLGIGLALVKQLVELHGGSVEAASDGVDQGATFTVRLPLMLHAEADRRLPAARGPAVATVSTSLAGVRLLVVDDDGDALDLFALVLRRAGAEVRAVPSVREALQALATWEPDVIVSDIEMPDESGYTFIRKLRGGQFPQRRADSRGGGHGLRGRDRADQDPVGGLRRVRGEAGGARGTGGGHRPPRRSQPLDAGVGPSLAAPAILPSRGDAHEALHRSLGHRRRHHAEPAVHQHAARGHAAPPRSRLLAGLERAPEPAHRAPTSTPRCTSSGTGSPPPRSRSIR